MARWGIVVLFGLVLGVSARVVDHLPGEVSWTGNLRAVWLGLAFGCGWLFTSARRGALAGALSLLTANEAYYLYKGVIEDSLGLRYLATVGLMWFVAGCVTGGALGYLGSLARTDRVPHDRAVAAVTGLLLGEGAALAVRAGRWEALVVEGLAAVLLWLLWVRPRIHAGIVVAATAAMAVFTLVSRLVLAGLRG